MRTKTVSAFLAGLVIGSGGQAGVRRLRPPADTTPPTAAPTKAPAPPPAPAPAPPAPADTAAADQRRLLVESLIGLADLVRDSNEALWERISDALAAVGVTTVIPDGGSFDTAQHDAVDRQPTADPDLHMTIASTDMAGYRDGGRWLRRPQVVVYRHQAPAPDTP